MNNILKSLLDCFVPTNNSIDAETGLSEQQSAIQKRLQEMKESKFYSNNVEMRKATRNVNQYQHQIDIKKDQIRKIYSSQPHYLKTKRIDFKSSKKNERNLPKVKISNQRPPASSLKTETNKVALPFSTYDTPSTQIAKLRNLYGNQTTLRPKLASLTETKAMKKKKQNMTTASDIHNSKNVRVHND